MAWRVDICDDELYICRMLQEYLARAQEELKESFSVRTFQSAEALLADFDEKTDLLLLDIAMDGITGMEAARRIRRRGNERLVLIFITSMTQYALEGYEVHAYGFLRKPLSYQTFLLQLRDALRLMKRNADRTIEIPTGSATEIIHTHNILYVEAFGHIIEIHLTGGRSLPCRIPLAELEAQLGDGFFRCHKSYLVSLRHIQRINMTTVALSDACELPISKHRRREFLAAFAGYREAR